MSGTMVYYNGVLFRDCEIHDWDQVIETDESGTVEKYSKIRVTVSSTLVSIVKPAADSGADGIPRSMQHPSAIQIPPILGETMPDRVEEIQIRLQEPRKDFWLAFHSCTEKLNEADGDEDYPKPKSNPENRDSYRLGLAATGQKPNYDGELSELEQFREEYINFGNYVLDVKREDVFDCHNGPVPEGLKITQVFAGHAVSARCSFEICRVLSGEVDDATDPGYDAQKAQGVICNRWSVVDSIDNDGRVSHHIRGKATVKDHRYKANAMRLFCFPLAFPYAKQTGRVYGVDPTGLTLEYSFTYTHAGAAPPYGVRDYEAKYIETVTAGTSGVKFGMMNIRVSGWQHREYPNTVAMLDREKIQKQLLLRALYVILYSRIRGISKQWNAVPGYVLSGQLPHKVMLDEARIIESVGNPDLEMSVNVRYTEDSNTEFFSRLTNMGRPIDIPNYDPRWWPLAGEFGRDVGDDEDNPYFRTPILPYANDGAPDKSDYFTGYFSSPGSRRHTVPRLTGRTQNPPDTDLGTEWAEPGGYVPEWGAEADFGSPGTSPSPSSPDGAPTFLAIEYPDLKGVLQIATSAPRVSEDYTGISDLQRSSFMYLHWNHEIYSEGDEGILHLPLSGVREREDGTKKWKESSAAVRLFPGISKRVYSVTATRYGKWPEVPTPLKEIIREKPLATSGSPVSVLRLTERLLKKEAVSDDPKLTADGCNRTFTIHCRWTYALSIPWNADESQGGDDAVAITLPVGKSPIDKATAAENAIEPIQPTSGTVASILFQPDTKYG